MKPALTHRQAECLNIIRDLTVDGVPPSFDEIRNGLGLKSKSPVHRLVACLEERGAIQTLPNRRRSIQIVESPSYQEILGPQLSKALDEAAAGLGISRQTALRQIISNWLGVA